MPGNLPPRFNLLGRAVDTAEAWQLARELIVHAYRQVATKRQLAALQRPGVGLLQVGER